MLFGIERSPAHQFSVDFGFSQFQVLASTMRHQFITNRTLRNSGILLVCVVFVCMCPGSTFAACGDYVTVTGRVSQSHAMTSHESEPNSLSDLDFGQMLVGQKLPRPKKTPCHGPNCSKQRSVPPMAPAAPLRLNLQDWAVLSGDRPDISCDDLVAPVADPSVGFAMSHFSRVFRPPR